MTDDGPITDEEIVRLWSKTIVEAADNGWPDITAFARALLRREGERLIANMRQHGFGDRARICVDIAHLMGVPE